MSTQPQILQRWRSSMRFDNPVESRYFLYERPENITAICGRCTAKLSFIAEEIPTKIFDEESGGYRFQKGEIGGLIKGRGACTKCGLVVHSINWPESAFFHVSVPEGVVWAWNEDYLLPLRARIAGDKVSLRHFLMYDWNLARFISRLPRFAVLKKNRSRILKRFNKITTSGQR
jgi:hypothetical protein